MATWYALKVQPEREDKIKNILDDRIRRAGLTDVIRTLLVPKESRAGAAKKTRGGDTTKKRVVEVKTYPGYIFVEMDLTDEAWYLINDTNGISGFVSANPRAPVPLPDDEIARILRTINESKESPKPKMDFAVGSTVRIKAGPFENFEGTVEVVDNEKWVLRLNVQIFGRSTPVEIGCDKVEKIDKA